MLILRKVNRIRLPHLILFMALGSKVFSESAPQPASQEVQAAAKYYETEMEKISIIESPQARQALGIPDDLKITVTVEFVFGPPGLVEKMQIVSMNYVDAPGLQLNPKTRAKITEKISSIFRGRKFSSKHSLTQPLPRIKSYYRFKI